MDNLQAIAIIENVGPETDEDTYLSAWQVVINSGLCFTRPRWARQSLDLIMSGRCNDPRKGSHAY